MYFYSVNKHHNCHIGFNDKLLMWIGIPILSFIVPIVFFDAGFVRPPFLTWQKYLATIVYSAILWWGNRHIMIYSRKKYIEFSKVKTRLVVQIVLMFVFTAIGNVLLGALFYDIYHVDTPKVTYGQQFVRFNAASLFNIIMIFSIYESIYFMHQLKHSIEEAETLKRESLNAQLNALRTQVNPHFLFNNLNTLVSLIPENQQHATEFVKQLSKVYRHILEVGNKESIPLQHEMDVLEAYYFLLQTRFGQNLKASIDPSCYNLNKKIVPLSLQILMENTIKHNIISTDKPLYIELYIEANKLVMKNNLQLKNQITESTGIGLDNIKNRYKLLDNYQIQIVSTNTHFIVSIPLLDN